jgi:hypothetical protein
MTRQPLTVKEVSEIRAEYERSAYIQSGATGLTIQRLLDTVEILQQRAA